ncbi:response regulator, partial [Candidatus Dependentiae bacterium]|nr:response regulator [Candidatus Dependentiae bacterium]
ELKGYNVIGFNSGEKTIEYLGGLISGYPELIITDYKLASKNGLELLNEIKNRFGDQIHIIIMTGYGDKSLVIDSFRQGADDFLDKPVSINNILESISKIEKKNKNILSKTRIEDYFSEVSHELRNRLTGIITHFDNLESKNHAENLDFIKNEVYNLDDMIKNILDIGNLETDRIKLNFSKVSIRELLEYSVNLLTPNAKNKGIKFETSINDCIISIDKEKMLQVLINLILNAIYYSNENSVISIRTFVSTSEIQIDIADQNEKIPVEYREKIFEKKFRLSENTKGYGIGLYIVKKIVNAHSGSINVVNNEDTGNIFRIKFNLSDKN